MAVPMILCHVAQSQISSQPGDGLPSGSVSASGSVGCDWESSRPRRATACLAGAGSGQLHSPIPCLVAIRGFVQTRLKHTHWADKLRNTGSSRQVQPWTCSLGSLSCGKKNVPFLLTELGVLRGKTHNLESKAGHPHAHLHRLTGLGYQ